MTNHAVFFDRDGTLNYDTGYLADPDKLVLYPEVGQGISKLKNKFGFKVIVISNQSGVARKLMNAKNVDAVNQRLNELLSEYETTIDAFYYCPFHPDFSSQEESECRKPSPKMVFDAAASFNIDLKRSYFVGDKSIDIECGINAGLKTGLMDYNNTNKEINILENLKKTPKFVADNFMKMCNFIINDFSGGNNC